MVKGLCESTKGEWSGYVDLNDSQLQLLYQELQVDCSGSRPLE